VDDGPPLFSSVFQPSFVPFFSRLLSCDRVHSQRTRRLAKEKTLYAQENQDQKLKLDKFVADSADDWDINNGVRHDYLSTHPLRSQDLTSDPSAMWPVFVFIRELISPK
jgi:hypothetical protein